MGTTADASQRASLHRLAITDRKGMRVVLAEAWAEEDYGAVYHWLRTTGVAALTVHYDNGDCRYELTDAPADFGADTEIDEAAEAAEWARAARAQRVHAPLPDESECVNCCEPWPCTTSEKWAAEAAKDPNVPYDARPGDEGVRPYERHAEWCWCDGNGWLADDRCAGWCENGECAGCVRVYSECTHVDDFSVPDSDELGHWYLAEGQRPPGYTVGHLPFFEDPARGLTQLATLTRRRAIFHLLEVEVEQEGSYALLVLAEGAGNRLLLSEWKEGPPDPWPRAYDPHAWFMGRIAEIEQSWAEAADAAADADDGPAQ